MQAVILAAGYGSRLGPLTEGKPKSLLQLNGESLIERAVRLLKEFGIEEIHVVTGFKKHIIEETLTSNVIFHHNPLYFCTNVLASFCVAMDSLNQDFVFLHADTVFEKSLLGQLLHANGDIILPVDFKVVQQEEMKVIVDDDNAIIELSKDISVEKAHGEFVGIAKISKGLINHLKNSIMDELKNKKMLQSYFEGALQNLIDNGFRIEALDISEKTWIEIDFEEDYLNAIKLFSTEQ